MGVFGLVKSVTLFICFPLTKCNSNMSSHKMNNQSANKIKAGRVTKRTGTVSTKKKSTIPLNSDEQLLYNHPSSVHKCVGRCNEIIPGYNDEYCYLYCEVCPWRQVRMDQIWYRRKTQGHVQVCHHE